MRSDETMLCRRLRIGAESGQNICFGEKDRLNYEVNVSIFLASRCPHRDKMIDNYAKMIMKWVLTVLSPAGRDQIERFVHLIGATLHSLDFGPIHSVRRCGMSTFFPFFASVAELLDTKGLPLKLMKMWIHDVIVKT